METQFSIVSFKRISEKVIGIRHGEKMYETLLTNEELAEEEKNGIEKQVKLTYNEVRG